MKVSNAKKIILKKYKCYMLYMIFFFTNTFIIKKYAFPVKNNLCIYYLILFVFIIIYKKEWFIRYVSTCGWWFDMFNFHQRAASLCYLHVCFLSESHKFSPSQSHNPAVLSSAVVHQHTRFKPPWTCMKGRGTGDWGMMGNDWKRVSQL